MKKKVLVVVLVVGMIAAFSSCKGLRSAPPCPAYTMVAPPASQVLPN